jgi:hypothetical protein
MAPTRNYPMCKNSAQYNRTRNFGLYGHAERKKTQKFVFRSALRPNQISFSHDQDPKATCIIGKSTSLGRHGSLVRAIGHPSANPPSRCEVIPLSLRIIEIVGEFVAK